MNRAFAIGVLGFGIMVFGMVRVDAANTGPIKVGYVDLQKTLNETKTGEKAKNKLEAEKKEKQKIVDKKKDDFKKKVEDLNKKKVVLKPADFEAQRAALENEYLTMQEQFMQLQQELVKREAMLTKEIFEASQAIIKDIAQKGNYTFILEKTESALLFADPAGDITAEVNKRLDAKK